MDQLWESDRRWGLGGTAKPMAFALVLLCAATSASADGRLPGHLQALFDRHKTPYENLRALAWAETSQHFGLSADDRTNRERFFRLGFLHELFKGAGAADCVSGGALRIPYFWHWVTPQPRHGIQDRRNGRPLVRVPPPRRFRRYASFAEIDRTPSLFLGDLVSEKPRYAHPDCGAFHTFGWCSEREMAFVLLAALLGYQGKVMQAGNHVTAHFRVPFARADGGRRFLVVEVDNTFGWIDWRAAPEGDLATWREVRAGAAYPNRMAASRSERRRVRAIRVGPKAAGRLEELVKTYLKRQAGAAGGQGP